MQYNIVGGNLPAVIVSLNQGESVKCESGAMSWMDPSIQMETNTDGGVGKLFGRMVTGESLMLNTYTASAPGEIAFASSFPGCIVPVQLAAGQSIIAQKDAFLACEESVNVATHIHEKVGGGLFGGMGFIMQKFTGPGVVFLEIDGSLEKYELAAGESKIVDGPHLAIIGNNVKFRVERIKGAKNIMFGGEGLFNTVVEGPGNVWLQSMPISNVAAQIAKYIPTSD